MSFISKEKTVEMIRSRECLECRWGVGSAYCEACTVGRVIRVVKEQEDLDLEPAREEAHKVMNFEEYGAAYVCSECRGEILHKGQKYCAFCGAKLNKEVERR